MRTFFLRVRLGILHIYIAVLNTLAGLAGFQIVDQADVRLLSDLVDSYGGLIGQYGTRLSRAASRVKTARLHGGFQFVRNRLKGAA